MHVELVDFHVEIFHKMATIDSVNCWLNNYFSNVELVECTLAELTECDLFLLDKSVWVVNGFGSIPTNYYEFGNKVLQFLRVDFRCARDIGRPHAQSAKKHHNTIQTATCPIYHTTMTPPTKISRASQNHKSNRKFVRMPW